MRIFLSAFLFMLPITVYADDCLLYKTSPSVNVTTPIWKKEVVQPLQPMDYLHGDVVATLVENFEIIGDTTSIEDGFCVSLKSVKATVGYSDFLVKIDIRHKPGTCSYDATMDHEDEHIRTYLSVVDDYHDKIQDAIYNAANSIMPVFVHNANQIDTAMDELDKKLQEHPDIVLINQKIQAEQEIRNKDVDHRDPGLRIKQCFE